MTQQETSPLVSVIVPVFNTPVDYLSDTLNSIVSQTLSQNLIELIIVDDCSTDPATCEFIETIESEGNYLEVETVVLRHKSNRWLAESRNTGATSAKGEYILFLDSDDYISPDYLKKGCLYLQANPLLTWIYPKTRLFGQYNESRTALRFDPFRILLRNKIPYASIFRTRVIRKFKYREILVLENIRFFEDWDLIIRLMSKGCIGGPLQDSSFFYRRHTDSIRARPAKLYLLSIYKTWQCNFFRLPFLIRAWIKNKRWQRKSRGIPPIYSPARISDRFQIKLIRSALETPEANGVLDARLLFLAPLFPRLFSKRFMNRSLTIMLSELKCGFRRKPVYDVSNRYAEVETTSKKETIMIAQTWWVVGGAENVLLDWVQSASSLSNAKLIDVCQYSDKIDSKVKERFASHCHEQYCLQGIGDNPLARLNFCWNLICYEKPKIIFISGNSYVYSLVPHIRNEFPETTIVDILHNEWSKQLDWFNIAYEHQDHIDYRLSISTYWKDLLIRKYNERSEKIIVLENGINVERFDPSRKDLVNRISLGIPENKTIVSFIGRLHSQKNPQAFMETAKMLQSKPDFHFLLVGDGPEIEGLRSNLELGNVTFIGESDRIPDILSHTSVLVCTSDYEGFPLVTLEAAAMNVPVIAPDITGFREQISQGNFGLLYESLGTAAEDGATIGKLITQEQEKLQNLKVNGRKYILSRFDSLKLNKNRSEWISLWLLPKSQSIKSSLLKQRKKITFHIGTHKTGSTSIQRFLFQNTRELSLHDVEYPTDFLFGYAHHALAQFFNRNGKMPDFAKRKFHTREIWDNALRSHIERLTKRSHSKIIYSSEAFWIGKPELLAEYFKDFEINVVVFLRRQDLWFESRFNQNSKITPFGHDSFGDFIDNQKTAGYYYERLSHWADIFGKENIQVFPFETQQIDGDLVRFFIKHLGITWYNGFEMPPSLNIKLNRACTEYIMHHPAKDRKEDQKFHRLLDCLEKYSAENPDPEEYRFVSTPEQRVKILEKYRSSNEMVAKEFLNRPDCRLFYDPEPNLDDNWKPYPGLSSGENGKIDAFVRSHGIRFH